MGKLILTEASGAVVEVPLEKERMTIGRHTGNDVCLNDKAVSGNHAAISMVGSTFLLEDLDSTNGTLVNGRQVAKHTLMPGDTITIGRNALRFEATAAAPAAAADPGNDYPPTVSPLSRELKGQMGKLTVLTGSNAGRELELTKTVTTLGKPGLQVVAITKKSGGYFVAHTGGAPNGPIPTLNGQDISADPVKLVNGDTLTVVGTQMQFTVIG